MIDCSEHRRNAVAPHHEQPDESDRCQHEQRGRIGRRLGHPLRHRGTTTRGGPGRLPAARRPDRSAKRGAEGPSLHDKRLVVERRSLHSASLRSAPVETTEWGFLARLTQAGVLRPIATPQPSQRGRPALRWEVNPALSAA